MLGSLMPNIKGKSYSKKKTGRPVGLLDGRFLRWKRSSSMFVFPARNGLLTRHKWTLSRQIGGVFKSTTSYLAGYGPRAFFRMMSRICVYIQLYGLPSVREICCGCLLWGGYCKNREMLLVLLSSDYTTRHTIVHLCIPELETFHLTPSQHLLFFLSSEGPHLQTKPPTDISGKWHLL